MGLQDYREAEQVCVFRRLEEWWWMDDSVAGVGD